MVEFSPTTNPFAPFLQRILVSPPSIPDVSPFQPIVSTRFIVYYCNFDLFKGIVFVAREIFIGARISCYVLFGSSCCPIVARRYLAELLVYTFFELHRYCNYTP